MIPGFNNDDLGINYVYTKSKKIERLLECGANPNYVKNGKNLLHWTIDYCYDDPDFMPIMQTFISFGTDPYKVSNKGNTIFHKAAKKGANTSIALSYLAKKATPKQTRLMTTILMLQRRKGDNSNFFSGLPRRLIIDCIFKHSLHIPTSPIFIANKEVLELENNKKQTVQSILDSKK